MNNTTLKYIILIFFVSLFGACDKQLEETNPNQSDSNSYWSTLDQTNSTLTAAYSTLNSHYVLNVREEAWRSDMAVPGFGRPSYTGDGVVWYGQSYNSSDKYIIGKWESLYLGVFRANQAIQGLNKLEGTVDQEQWIFQMAQARFLRGLFHFYLHSAFNKGNIIIRDKVPESTQDYNKSISPSADVIAFFRKDLRYAYDNLPAQQESTNLGRVTRGAAATILGTSYLYENEIDSAIVMFDDIVNNVSVNYGYELVTDPDLQFTTAGEMNKESIFEINYNNESKQELSTWVEDRNTNRLAGNSIEFTSNAFFPSSWITWEYMNEPMDKLDERNFTVDLTDPVNPDTTYHKISCRAAAMIALSTDDETLYYGKFAHEVSSFNFKNSVSRYKKYTNHDILSSENDNPGGRLRSAKNITVNRLADVYLMLAECYVNKGDVAKATELINAVRGRWALQLIGPSNGDTNHSYDEINYTAELLLERLQNIEKPLELSVEGYCIRWFDLRRWGKLKENFEKHAQEKFWVTYNSGLNKADGTVQTGGIIALTDADAGSGFYEDYAQAVANFNYEQHAWLPIPSTEELNNQGLYGN